MAQRSLRVALNAGSEQIFQGTLSQHLCEVSFHKEYWDLEFDTQGVGGEFLIFFPPSQNEPNQSGSGLGAPTGVVLRSLGGNSQTAG